MKVLVNEGDTVDENQIVAVVEAMKMETNVTAGCAGVVEHVYAKPDQMVEASELLISLKEE